MSQIMKSMTNIFKNSGKSKEDVHAIATTTKKTTKTTKAAKSMANGAAAIAEKQTKSSATAVTGKLSKAIISGPMFQVNGTTSRTSIIGQALYEGHHSQIHKQQQQQQQKEPNDKKSRRKKSKRPIFGVALLQLEQSHGKQAHVPRFVVDLVFYIERNFIRKEGLYRISGRSADIADMRHNLNIAYDPKMFENVDVNVLTSILKLFFRELPESLLPSQACDLFHNKNTDVEITNELRKIFEELPNPRAAVIKFLIKHFVHVTSHSYDNRMTAYNLATVWGPTLVWVENICQIPLTTQLLKTLIQGYNVIFNEP